MNNILQEAIIVAAHPDDEILWFSSVIEEVKKIVICYIKQASRPDWTSGRLQALADYPLANIHPLNLNLSEVFDCGDWQYPRTTAYGMDISRKGCPQHNYASNYHRLKSELKELLRPHKHVFTHNPWGEYGHEEHVQVFRAVESLQSQMGFTLWVSSYVSNRSISLLLSSLGMIDDHFFCKPTNKKIAAQIRDWYIRCGCWTWYPAAQWCDEDVFLKIKSSNQQKRSIGKMFPMNFIDFGEVRSRPVFIKKTDSLVRQLCSYRNRIFSRNKD